METMTLFSALLLLLLQSATGVAESSMNTGGEESQIHLGGPSSWVFPLLLSCLAGASTCVGASVVFCFRPSAIRRSMAFSLSMAAAVMITISVVSILPEVARGILVAYKEEQTGASNDYGHNAFGLLLLERLFWFGVGVGAYLLLARLLVLLPEPEHLYLLEDPGDDEDHKRNYDLYLSDDGGDGKDEEASSGLSPLLVRRRATGNTKGGTKNVALDRALSSDTLSSSNHSSSLKALENTTPYPEVVETGEDLSAFSKERRRRSWRVTLMLFASLLIHNFPEGLCVAASAKESPELGITVAIGIFIHNVPEGIAISVPCIAARPDQPWLAFWLASASGLAEPLGAVVALSMLGASSDPPDLENVLSFVAGVMITVALRELYPEALKAAEEASKHSQQHSTRDSTREALLFRSPRLSRFMLQPQNRSIVWGSVMGTALMVATELYLT
ncbi:unnamed protein product [Pseudo-nitzschia multistriata]|uniref:Uncharacterized protein n=1 Tax=Pseudo-nitzschia multistriata TaxID=183589 RepID=A0A448YXD8_9STRA|nr:unnamed protein product [Pseudo-nitzschia multistriata]